MRPEHTAVVDIGKTNVKLCVVSPGGSIVSQRSRPNRVLHTDSYPHFDVEGIFEWLLQALAEAQTQFPLSCISTTTHGATAALMSGESLALPVLDYEFEGVESISEEYESSARDFSKTASPRLPAGLNLGRQLYWQARTHREAFASVTDILLYPQYWAFRLSGAKATEVTSLGCHTDLWQPSRQAFSDLSMREGWSKLFPALSPAWESVGSLRPELALRTRIDPGCRVLAGIHDSNASFFSHRASRDTPFAVVSTGTWVVCMSSGTSLESLDERLDTLANVDAFGAPVPCSRFMGGREFHAIAGDEGLDSAPQLDDITRLVARGTRALPAFARQGGPFRDSEGCIEGPVADAPQERAGLAALYCALHTDYCLDLLGVSGEVLVEGSFVKHDAYARVLAALRPKIRVQTSSDTTGTVRGAAALANWPAHAPQGIDLTTQAAYVIPGLDVYSNDWRAAARARQVR